MKELMGGEKNEPKTERKEKETKKNPLTRLPAHGAV
jgi:hypothetical protein